MKVLRFSIGFGKPLVTWIGRGNDRTEYCLSAVPLGGYVRFLDSREADIAPEDEGRAFDQRPVPSRIAVLLAGPAFNFLFAIAAYWVIFASGVPTMLPTVGQVESDSYADAAGLEFGDRIVAVGDRETGDWETALVAILDGVSSDGRVPLRLQSARGIERAAIIQVGDDASHLTEPGMIFTGLGFEPWRPPAVVGEVVADGAASATDLAPGDRIVSVAGIEVLTSSDLINVVSERPGERVALDFYRGQQRRTLDIEIGSAEVDGATVGRIGVQLNNDFGEIFYLRKFGPLAAFGEASQKTWDTMAFTLRMLGRMVTGDVSIKNISGPINIAQFAGDSAERGLNQFLTFLALVSISLGVLNLLPVPVLDGGQIVYQTVELLKGSPMSERSQIIGQQFGILALVLLMSFAVYNDISRILG
jgi:regulator of sigma E protease